MIKNLYFICPAFSLSAASPSKAKGLRDMLNDTDADAAFSENQFNNNSSLNSFESYGTNPGLPGGWILLVDMELMKNEASAIRKDIN